jgi:hypothetical protein
MGKPNLAAGRFDVAVVNGKLTLVITSQTDDQFESAEYLTKGVYRITLRSGRHVRGADDVFYTGTSLGLHVGPTQGLGDTVECAGGFENGRAQVVVKIYGAAGDPVDSAFYLFAALKD